MSYDSKFEVKVNKKYPKLARDCDKFKYTWPEQLKTYTPDFLIRNKTYLEVKGRFKDLKAAQKHIHIRNSNPDIDIVFLFQKPDLPMPGAQKRKDGTKRSHAEWAEKNGFEWYTIESFKEFV